jgi:LPXTG-motif cell wall-anchored protein
VGTGSGGTGSTIWLLPIGLLAFLGGAFALVIRRRRLA